LVYGWNELQKIQYLQGELRKLKEAEIEDNEPGPLHVLSCGLAKVFFSDYDLQPRTLVKDS
jgi:hypothetical protein